MRKDERAKLVANLRSAAGAAENNQSLETMDADNRRWFVAQPTMF